MIQLCTTHLPLIKRFASMGYNYRLIIDHDDIEVESAIVCDPRMAHELLAFLDDPLIIVLSDTPDNDEGIQLFRKGVRGYGNTYMHLSILLKAIRTVENGKAWIHPPLKAVLFQTHD